MSRDVCSFLPPQEERQQRRHKAARTWRRPVYPLRVERAVRGRHGACVASCAEELSRYGLCCSLSHPHCPLPHQPNTPPPPPCVCRAAHALRTAKPISRSGSPSMNPRHVQLVCDSQLDLAMIGGVHEPSGDILDGWRGQGAVVEEIGDGTHALLGCEVEVAQVHLAPLGVDIVLEVEFG